MGTEWTVVPPRRVPRPTVNTDKRRARYNSSCRRRHQRRRGNASPRRLLGYRRHHHPRVLLVDRVRGRRHGHRQHQENGNEVQTFTCILHFDFP